MKRRRFPIILIFLSALTLLFSGCDVDSFAYITQDGSTVEYNTNSGTVTVDTPDETNVLDEDDADDESDEDEESEDEFEDEDDDFEELD